MMSSLDLKKKKEIEGKNTVNLNNNNEFNHQSMYGIISIIITVFCNE